MYNSEKSSCPSNFLPAILEPEMPAPIYGRLEKGRLEKYVFSAGKTHAHKITRFEGRGDSGFGGGGKCPFCFYGRRIFLNNSGIALQHPPRKPCRTCLVSAARGVARQAASQKASHYRGVYQLHLCVAKYCATHPSLSAHTPKFTEFRGRTSPPKILEVECPKPLVLQCFLGAAPIFLGGEIFTP